MEPEKINLKSNLNSIATIPGSKSCTARALVMAALTKGRTTLIEPADCDDSNFLVGGLKDLGLQVEVDENCITVNGKLFKNPRKPLFLGNSGTAIRFLSAACSTLNGEVILDGVERMRQRPISDLLESLQLWGVEAKSETGCPPLVIKSSGKFGGKTKIKGTASSQYLTGLLLVAPLATEIPIIEVEGELVSKPYIDLTIAMMEERGVDVINNSYQSFEIRPGQNYKPETYPIEADASGASYFYAAAAVAGGKVRVLNITGKSHQGDSRFPWVLEQMGCTVQEGPNWIEVSSDRNLKGIDIDLNAMPDMAQTLAVTALFAEGPTTIRNVENMRIKECDRISASVIELRKLGAEVEEFQDGMKINPSPLKGVSIDTYDDHRMAMSFALAGLRVEGVLLNDPGCVSKTFPDFFQRFGNLK